MIRPISRAAIGSALLVPLLAGSSIGATAAPSAPPAVPTRIDLFDRRLEFVLPTNFVRVTNKVNGTNALIEFAPKGETTANWTQMVTVQAYRGLGRSPHPTSAIARQAFYPAACKIGPIYGDFGEKLLKGDLKRTIITNGCASLPAGAYPKALKGAGEQDFIMLFRDSETVYTLNIAVRGASFAGKAPPIDVARSAEILATHFGMVRLDPMR